MHYGLIGKPLGHSWSPRIHALLADYKYELFPLEPEELAPFLARTDLGALNVTAPYKKDVIPFCSALTDAAEHIGSVNVLKFTKDGILGDNTDCDGFLYLARRTGIDFTGKKVLILGSGGTSLTARYCASLLGAGEIRIISRRGPDNYKNLEKHGDAQIIVNTTPLGMYPDNGSQALTLEPFPSLEGVLDVVYNPLRTSLVQEAHERGIPASSGLPMLIAQAVAASERFTDSKIGDEKTEQVLRTIRSQIENIVLIGMPGCGKTSIGSILSEKTGRPFVDLDAEVAKTAGCSVPDLILMHGLAHFRQLEADLVRRFAKETGLIIACGGGTPLDAQNTKRLKQNGKLFFLERDLSLLPAFGRPLSVDLQELALQRTPVYEAVCDFRADNNGSREDTAQQILSAFFSCPF